MSFLPCISDISRKTNIIGYLLTSRKYIIRQNLSVFTQFAQIRGILTIFGRIY
jgi:hypothetical protein